MEIKILDKAIKDLKRIDKVQAKRILNSVSELVKYPNIANVKRLTNYNPTHRLRVGDYRVLFNVKDNGIVVSRIRHRKDVYWYSETALAWEKIGDNTVAGIAQRYGIDSEAVMIGVGGAADGAFGYKYGKPIYKKLPLPNKSKQSHRVTNNNGSNKHSQTNSDNFNQHHDNAPFNELYNYTTDKFVKQSTSFLNKLKKLNFFANFS